MSFSHNKKENKEEIMAFIIIVLIVGLVVFFKIYNSPKEKIARELSKGKNQEQIKTIRFFLGTIFGPKWGSDSEYESYLKSIVHTDVQQAIDKLGVDESEVNEINPVLIEGYLFNKNSLTKRHAQNNWISSGYHTTWLLFSATQVYIYRREFYADENRNNVSTLEYFYRDITAFRTGQESYEVQNKITNGTEQISTDTFQVVVPGDDMKVSVNDSPDFESKVQAMKQLLREKKNA